MLTAEKPSPWHKHYDISLDGRPIARWEPSWWASGGVFNLDGQRYEVRSSLLGSRFQLIGPAGPTVGISGAGRPPAVDGTDGRPYLRLPPGLDLAGGPRTAPQRPGGGLDPAHQRMAPLGDGRPARYAAADAGFRPLCGAGDVGRRGHGGELGSGNKRSWCLTAGPDPCHESDEIEIGGNTRAVCGSVAAARTTRAPPRLWPTSSSDRLPSAHGARRHP